MNTTKYRWTKKYEKETLALHEYIENITNIFSFSLLFAIFFFLLSLSSLSLSLGLSTSIPFCSQDSNSCVLLSRNKVRLLNATQIIHLQIKNEYQYIKIIVSIGVSTPLFLKGKSANCLSPPSPPPPLRAIPLYYWLFMIPLPPPPPHTHLH